MEKDFDRINDAVNVVVPPLGRGQGNERTIIMNDDTIYRITGDSQINDMIDSGYVRPQEDGNHGSQVFWTQGRNGYTLNPGQQNVIEVSSSRLQNGQIGAVPVSDIQSILQWSEQENRYIDRIQDVKGKRSEKEPSVRKITAEEIAEVENKMMANKHKVASIVKAPTQKKQQPSSAKTSDSQEIGPTI